MKLWIPAGLLALIASIALTHGTAEANNKTQGGAKLSKGGPKGVNFSKNVNTNFNNNLVSKTGPIVGKGKSPVTIDLAKKNPALIGTAKKGPALIDLGKKGPALVDLGKKGTSLVDIAKKGGPIVTPVGKGTPNLIGKNGKSLVKNDLFAKPFGGKWNADGWWGGWHGHHHHHGGHWWGGWHGHHHCGPWWGGCWSWCAPSYGYGGWFSSWCSPVIMEPIIMEVPVGGPLGDPGQVSGPAANPGQVAGPEAGPPPNAEQLKPQTKRFLSLKNESGEKLQVFVQYVVRTEDGDALWMPGEPESDKALQVTLEVGQELFVENKGKRIATNVIRIWAVSEKGKFMEFRGQDLRIVPEQDQSGEFVYMAPEIKTFTFVFPPLSEMAPPVGGIGADSERIKPSR